MWNYNSGSNLGVRFPSAFAVTHVFAHCGIFSSKKKKKIQRQSPPKSLMKAATILQWAIRIISTSLQNRQRMMGQCSKMDYYYVASPFSAGGRTVTAGAFSLPKHRHKWFGSLTWLGMLQRWYITCYQPYLDHSVPISISGAFSLFSQDQPHWGVSFFASYLSHLELISFFSDSHFAVKNLTNHWHVQNLSAQNFFCLTCINYTAYLFSDQSTYTWIHCTLEETTPLPPTPETCYMLPRLRKEQTV